MIQILFSIMAVAFAAESGTIQVQLKGVQEKRKGPVLCALFRSPAGFPAEHERALEIQHASKAEVGWCCTFYNLKPSRYAVSVVHDEDGDGKLKRNKFGIPEEGWATSKNVVPGMRAPNFKESAVKLDGGVETLSLNMHY